MKRLLKWFLMLNKRLYKKATFVVILCIIPLAALALGIAARQDSGFVTVALAREDSADEISGEIVEKFLNEDSLIHFVEYSSAEEAFDAVKYGSADAVWIFPAGIEERVNAFSASLSETDSAVRVIEREESVALRLTREKLSAALYKYTARAFYLDFARTANELDSLSDSEILSYYDNLDITEQLFTFDSDFSGEKSQNQTDTSYLLAPVRGLLGILTLLCAMAAMMFFMQDEKFGTFSLVPQNRLNFVAFACVTIAVLNVAAVVLLSLWATGIATVIIKEILQLLLYSLCCASFCMLLREIFPSIRLYGSVIPLFVIITIAVCPVFFDFRSKLFLQLIFPPTYYINSVYNNLYLLYMPLYTAVCSVLTIALQRLRRKAIIQK